MNLKLDKITIIVYAVLIGFLILVIWMEWKDLSGKGHGVVAIKQGKPQDGDSRSETAAKIKSSCRYEYSSIFWRRCYVAAAVSAFVSLYVAKSKLPNGFSLATSFLITYIIVYLTFTIFQKWIADPAVKQVDVLVDKLHPPASHSRSS